MQRFQVSGNTSLTDGDNMSHVFAEVKGNASTATQEAGGVIFFNVAAFS
jgi:hypothetical protein